MARSLECRSKIMYGGFDSVAESGPDLKEDPSLQPVTSLSEGQISVAQIP